MHLSVSRTRSSVHSDLAEGSVSIPMLNRHIHMLRKRIRHFEERFEHEKHYKVRGGGCDVSCGQLDSIEELLD